MDNLNININDLKKNKMLAGFASSILPLSGETQELVKVPLGGYTENSSLYQHCTMCNKETQHYQVRNASGLFVTCTKCAHGYKIS
jgi:hypothetical protein